MIPTRDPNISLLARALTAGRLAAQSVGLRLAAVVIIVAASIALVASVTSTAAQTDRMVPEEEDFGGEDDPVASTATQTCVEEAENLGTLRAATIERSGELSDGDCLARVRGNEDQWVDRFVFTLSEPAAVRVELLEDSGSFDPATDTGRQPQWFDAYLVLNNQDGSQVASDDDGGTGNNSLISRELNAGTYEIVATSLSPSPATARHLYRLAVGLDPCQVEPLGVLASVSATTLSRTGSFATSGCSVGVDWQTSNPGAVYTFELAEPRSVQIGLQGLDGVDSYLKLRSEGQNWYKAEDNDAGPGRDASIRHNLPAGEHRIEASYRSGTAGEGSGRYRLTLTVDAVTSCEEDQLGFIHGTIVRSGEFGVDGCITNRYGSYYWSAVHVFSLAEPGRIQIDLDGIGWGVDPTLWLTDGRGNRVADDWDGGAGRGARIERELAAGTYLINAQRADGYQGEPGGQYRLTIDATSQPLPPSRDAGRIVVRRLADGRTEFGWLPKGADADARILPDRRHLEAIAGAEVGRWGSSGPVEVAGVIVGWINYRVRADGRVELGFTTTNGERILPRGRLLPANPSIDRWVRSSEIEISESTE